MAYLGSNPTTQNFIAGTDAFNGTGSATNFTLSRRVNSVNDIQVVVNNVVQYPPNYSVSGNTLTISPAPSAGTNNVYVRYLSTTLQSIAPAPGTTQQFASGTAANPSITFIGDTNTGIFSPAADTIAFTEGGVESMRIDASGNVGLGVTPSAWGSSFRAMQIGSLSGMSLMGYGGAAEFGNNFYYDTAYRYGATGTAARYVTSSAGHIWYNAPSGTAGNAITFTQAMTLDASGNLLVGGTTSRTRLTLQAGEANAPTLGTASGGAFFGNSNSTYGTLFGTSGSGFGWIQQQRVDGTGTAYDLCLQPSGGNLLVGTTNTIIWNTTNTGVVIGGSAAPAIQISRSGDVALLLNRLASDGSIQIFARQGTQVGRIDVTTTATAYVTSSDYRLKEDVQPMTGALAKVALLKPCTYKWKADGSDGEGFIAHELAEVCPQAVVGEKDAVYEDGSINPQGIDTSFLVATLTAAIQELKAELDATKAEVALLKPKVGE